MLRLLTLIVLVGVSTGCRPKPRPPTMLSPPPPSEEGVVLEVKGAVIEISLGSQDGVEAGDRFYTYRADHFAGEYEVTQVHPERSLARHVGRQVAAGPPRRNDPMRRKESTNLFLSGDGVVLSANNADVVISLGSDQGVRPGDRFHAYRGSRLGYAIVITAVQRNTSRGSIRGIELLFKPTRNDRLIKDTPPVPSAPK